MGIVVIHGAGPGSGKPNVVARLWQDALMTGLRAAGLRNSEEQEIRFASDGDIGRDGRAAANGRPTDLQLAIADELGVPGREDERPGCGPPRRPRHPAQGRHRGRTRAC